MPYPAARMPPCSGSLLILKVRENFCQIRVQNRAHDVKELNLPDLDVEHVLECLHNLGERPIHLVVRQRPVG